MLGAWPRTSGLLRHRGLPYAYPCARHRQMQKPLAVRSLRARCQQRTESQVDSIHGGSRSEDSRMALYDVIRQATSVRNMIEVEAQRDTHSARSLELQDQMLELLQEWGRLAQAAGEHTRVYHDIKVYVRSPLHDGYAMVVLPCVTKKELMAMWQKAGYCFVLIVDSMPTEFWTIDNCPQYLSMDKVMLDDGMQLALVAHRPGNGAMWAAGPLRVGPGKATKRRVIQRDQPATEEQDVLARAYALEQIQHEPGAQLFDIKIKPSRKSEVVMKVLQNVAYSDSTSIYAQHVQVLTYTEMLRFIFRAYNLWGYIRTGLFYNTIKLQGRHEKAVLMVDSLTADADEQASIKRRLCRFLNSADNKCRTIEVVLPDGIGGWARWDFSQQPPDNEVMARRFLDTHEGETRIWKEVVR